MLIKKFSLNQLTIRTFTVFWLAFFAMTALLVALPYFDSRLYSDLNQNEISSYQKKLVESIRNNRINGILAGVPVLPTDKFDSARPVIMTPEKEIFGALGEERIHIAQFAQESSTSPSHNAKRLKIFKLQDLLKSILAIPTKHPNYSLCLEQMANKKSYVICLITLGSYCS